MIFSQRSSILVILLLQLSLTGCGEGLQQQLKWRTLTSGSPLSIEAQETESTYRDQYELWTRRREQFTHFEGRLIASATLLSPELEIARTRFHQHTLKLTELETEKLIQSRVKHVSEVYRIFLTVSSADGLRIHKELADDPWAKPYEISEDHLIVHLLVDGEPINPTLIEAVSFSRGQALSVDFSDHTSTRAGYWFEFPMPPRDGKRETQMTLRLASSPATVELHWHLQP